MLKCSLEHTEDQIFFLLSTYAFQKNSRQEVQTVQSETRLEAVLSWQPHEPLQNATG